VSVSHGRNIELATMVAKLISRWAALPDTVKAEIADIVAIEGE